ncbi:hypothetical protein RRG08_005661 [Elysia crispata]|uniref:CWH43-like N-terminal domain-containing protein n=1 Tax=Elysia crispata TaxID=231223 RepID=A0AAE0YDK3_9GAST|nr:hypothetical protein RRG08_005661 [Elysia crispata]
MASRRLPQIFLTVSLPTVGTILCCLPLFAALFCVVWSIVFDLKTSTATQCRVANYLPSMSAAIGDSTPQRYVWRICVCLHATPRLVLTLVYRELHGVLQVETNKGSYRLLVSSAAFSNGVEVSSLIALSYISSTENYEVHEALFVIFMVSGLLHMVLTITLFSWRHRCITPSGKETKSLCWKRRLFAVNVSTFLVSVYLFFRHNWYCEPGVYTLFAACEYLVVLTNISFHGTLIWDLDDFSMAVVNTTLISDNTRQRETGYINNSTRGEKSHFSDTNKKCQ